MTSSARTAPIAAVILLIGCASSTGSMTPRETAPIFPAGAQEPAPSVYQPLGKADSWTYVCNNQFTIVDKVIGTLHVNKRLVYVFQLQIPSSPSKSVYVRQLLANDDYGNTWIYGYLIHNKVRTVTPTKIVVPNPVLNAHYDYPAPTRGKISRVFKGFEYTHKTPLGTFWVAPYFESGGTHNYGYNKGRGVMEEDHGPNYEFDCLIEKYVLH